MSGDSQYRELSVLVTGAQGFVGAWLAGRLLEEGARVTVPRRDIDPRSRFRTEGIEERCQVVQADVTDYGALLRVLERYEVEAAFHLAAQPIVGIANRGPLSTFESNIRGTYTLLEACRARAEAGRPLERVVVASSDHAYGPQAVPYREEYGLKADFPYDVSKACTDMIARSYADTHDMPVAVTRLANVYGGGDRNWSRIVPDCARALVEGRRPVIRSDGTPARDFLYVRDAVEVYLTVGRSLDQERLWGRAWNAGMGRPVSVLELVQRLIAVSGQDVRPDIRGSGTPQGEIDRQYLDSTRIREELGWTPRFDLDQGLAEAYEWYERHLAGAPGQRATAQHPVS